MTTLVPTFPDFPVLNNAIDKCRRLAAISNSFQYTNEQVIERMESFYLYDLPAKFRSLKLKDVYTFTTNAGQDVYPFNSELYTTVNMPCYCSKREIKLFNDPWNFYAVNYNWQSSATLTTGNGTTGPYSGFTIGSPLVASFNNDPGPQSSPNLYFPMGRVQNILISANIGFGQTQNVTDDGSGNLIQIFDTSNTTNQEYGWTYYRQYASVDPTVATATIDYQTGEVSDLYFDQVIPSGTPIYISYNSVVQSIPLSIMFYQNQFTLRPVPDKGYTIELSCYRQPIKALLSSTQNGNTELSEWWELLAVGGAKKFYEERLDPDGIMLMDKMLRERYDVVESRTYAQISQQRIQTIYTDQLTHNYSNNGLLGGLGQ